MGSHQEILKCLQTQFPPIRKQDRPKVTKRRPRHSLRTFPRSLNSIHMRLPWSRRIDCSRMPILLLLWMSFTVKEVRAAIRELNPRKALSYNQSISAEAAKKRKKFITQLCNAILRRDFFSSQWKIAQIIMIQKPGKFAESYRSINLLLVLLKLFEKLLLPSVSIIMERLKIIPSVWFST